MFNRYSMSLSPKPKSFQDILAEKFRAQQMETPPTVANGIFSDEALPGLEPQEPLQQALTAPPPQLQPQGVDFGSPVVRKDVGRADFGVPQFEIPQVTPAPQTPSVLDRMRALKNPQMDELAALLQSGGPKREDFKPGAMDRIAAALVGASAGFDNPIAGYKASREIMDEPYNKAYGDYETKLKTVGSLANLKEGELDRQMKMLDTEQRLTENDRTFEMRVKEFEARMKELEEKDWDVDTSDITGKKTWSNRKTGQVIEGPQLGESRKERTDREAAIAKALAEARKAEVDTRAEAQKSIADANNAAKKEIAANKLSAASERLKYAPMSESQRQAGLNQRLQNLISAQIDPFRFLEYDPVTHLYTEGPGPNAAQLYFMSEEERAKVESDRLAVRAALGTGAPVAPGTTTVPPPAPTATPNANIPPAPRKWDTSKTPAEVTQAWKDWNAKYGGSK